MSYTKNAPTQAGDYRWKESLRAKDYRLVKIERDGAQMAVQTAAGNPPGEMGGVWEGPLETARQVIRRIKRIARKAKTR